MGPLKIHAAVDSVVEIDGLILIAQKYGAPTSSAPGYLPGCLFIDTLNAKHYKNTGTVTSATWQEQTQA